MCLTITKAENRLKVPQDTDLPEILGWILCCFPFLLVDWLDRLNRVCIFFSHKCVCVSLYMFVNLHLCNVHFSAFWFSSLAGPLPGNISGFSVSVALTLFFSLNLPECDTLTWRPLLAVVLSTIFPSRASSWASSVWAAAPEAALERCWLLGELDTNSGEISYKTFGWDFFLLIKVSFHQPVDDSAMMNKMWGGINLKRRKKIN